MTSGTGSGGGRVRGAARQAVHPHVVAFDAEDTVVTAPRLPPRAADEPTAFGIAVTREMSEMAVALASAVIRLPAKLLLEQGDQLRPSFGEITDVSDDAAFVAADLRPRTGARVHLRTASRHGVGFATGHVGSLLLGAGFTIRIDASTPVFRHLVAAVRACEQSEVEVRKPPVGEIELHVLQ